LLWSNQSRNSAKRAKCPILSGTCSRPRPAYLYPGYVQKCTRKLYNLLTLLPFTPLALSPIKCDPWDTFAWKRYPSWIHFPHWLKLGPMGPICPCFDVPTGPQEAARNAPLPLRGNPGHRRRNKPLAGPPGPPNHWTFLSNLIHLGGAARPGSHQEPLNDPAQPLAVCSQPQLELSPTPTAAAPFGSTRIFALAKNNARLRHHRCRRNRDLGAVLPDA
jgi:hypothetical protein